MADANSDADPARPELATFLRSRRERVTPEMVGLRFNGRRRTPGLRREELALLAGISVDYLTRIEQGRETNPSTAVLKALAEALQLSDDEREHLGKLNLQERCESTLCVTETASAVDVDTLALLDRFDGSVAVVVNAVTDVLARNDTFEQVYGETGVLDGDPPNFMRYTFLHPAAREVLSDWDAVAQGYVAALRSRVVRFHTDESMARFVQELRDESPEFARLWDAHDVARTSLSRQRLEHPRVGDLQLQAKALPLPDLPGALLIVQWPADDASTAAFENLTAMAESDLLVAAELDQ